VIVAVVVVTLTEVAGVFEIRVFLTDGVADAPATLTPTVTAAQRARVVAEKHFNTNVIFSAADAHAVTEAQANEPVCLPVVHQTSNKIPTNFKRFANFYN